MNAHNCTKQLGGYEHLANRVYKPWADRGQILETQAAVATLVASWQTSGASLHAIMDRVAKAMSNLKSVADRYDPPKSALVQATENFLEISMEAAVLLGALLAGNVQTGVLANIVDLLALRKTPMLAGFLKAVTAEGITFDFRTQGTSTVSSQTVTPSPQVKRNWNDPSNALLANFLWTDPQYLNLKAQLDQVKQCWAELDYLVCLAHAAVKYQLVCPEIVDRAIYDVSGGKHPLLWMWHLDPSKKPYHVNATPAPCINSISLERGPSRRNTMIITGPNSGGKTSLMQQVGLSVVMALMGGFVPAEVDTLPKIGIFDAIETLFGSSGRLGEGGTHAMEVRAVGEVYGRTTDRTLLLVDEPYRSTDPDSGRALTHATIAAMGERAGLVMMATNQIDRLATVAAANPFMTLAHMGHSINGSGDPVPSFLLRPGVTTLRHYGIAEAKRVGLHPDIAGRV